jgi:hypothetical protein
VARRAAEGVERARMAGERMCEAIAGYGSTAVLVWESISNIASRTSVVMHKFTCSDFCRVV